MKKQILLFLREYLGVFLFMIFLSGLLADEINHENIGVPVIPNAVKGRHVDSAFMSPDGEHFYTLYEGRLTKFSINPFQKVSSSEIDFKEILSGKNFFKVFITSDEKRLIISNNKKSWVALVDITTGDIIKTITIDISKRTFYVPDYHREVTSSSRMIDAVLNGDEFLVFKDHEILVFDADTLTKKRELAFDWRAGAGFSSVHKVLNKIIYIGARDVGLIYGKNYQKKELYTSWDLPKSNRCWNKGIGKAHIDFDLNSLENGEIKKFNICGFPVKNDESFVDKKTIELGFGPITTAGHYVVSGYRYTLKNLKTSKKYTIVQYQDGEVILFDKSSEKRFTLTSKARKHLEMKNSMGEIVPMNDTTFNKYQIPNP